MSKSPPRDHKVVCISMYEDDLNKADQTVKQLKLLGFTKANRSWLIRMAIKQFDTSLLTEEDNWR
jgi:hypothetical protein